MSKQLEEIQHLIKMVQEMEAAVKAASDKLKPAFVEYITNKELPLDERWLFWVSAPKELKNEEPWISHIEFDGEEIFWFDGPHYYEKRMTILMTDVVSTYIDNNKWEVDKYSEEAIAALKEDILASNVYSFELDW